MNGIGIVRLVRDHPAIIRRTKILPGKDGEAIYGLLGIVADQPMLNQNLRKLLNNGF